MASKNLTVDTTQLARFLDITPRWVRELKNDGVLTNARDADGSELRGRYELLVNNIAYIRHLRGVGKVEGTSESQYALLRNRRITAETERAELELKLYKGQLHRAEDVEFILTTRITAAKTRILAIASRVSRLVIGLTDFKRVHTLIYGECESALNEVAGINSKAFTQAIVAYLQNVSENKRNADS